MPIGTTLKKYNGVERAAVLVMSLPDEQIAKVFAQLDKDEIRELSQAMSSLGKVESHFVEQLCMDFFSEMVSSGSLVGSVENTERLLKRVLSEKEVDEIMDEVRGPVGRTLWYKLCNVDEEVLANYLKNEYPQTIAVVLSRIKAENASRILGLLPESLANDVVFRMLKMEVVRKEVIEEVESTLRTEFINNLSSNTKRDAYELVAEIFNYLDRSAENRLISGLESRHPESAEIIRNLIDLLRKQ